MPARREVTAPANLAVAISALAGWASSTRQRTAARSDARGKGAPPRDGRTGQGGYAAPAGESRLIASPHALAHSVSFATSAGSGYGRSSSNPVPSPKTWLTGSYTR